ncbi:mitochondrial ubiquitin ligase activator of NFKB 1-like [Anneissia japonica]|uniref:mitochondrial ubiquitin ligase activator of NFKB 1-like n=1 Tax=Anneissia japonica TaxID=1529436 RepID=UPI0014256271|nr:mitochondrial ubiquitin ligase activator of NFKB 1-like [Anneissia japonica]
MIFDWIALGSGAFTSAVLYYVYRKKTTDIQRIHDAPMLTIDKDLSMLVEEAPDKTIPYAVIEGAATPVKGVIHSQNIAGITGLIQSLILKEHKTEWSKSTRMWIDSASTIKHNTKSVPFRLSAKESHVTVDEALVATGLTLDVIHDKFEPIRSSLGDNLVNWATGEKIKGYQELEEMLPVDSFITGIGEIKMIGGQVHLVPPCSGWTYYLWRGSKAELLRDLRSNTRVWRIVLMFFGSATLLWCLYLLSKWYKKYQEEQNYREYLARVRQAAGNGEETEVDVCAVCLENPRDCVILNCGHVCACQRCTDVLNPPQCPICRERISRVVPLFHA